MKTPAIQPFAEDVWVVDGPDVRDMGILFTTRMTIVRLGDGSLWLDSPVPLPFATLQDVSAMGPVRFLVAATPRHVWRLDTWHTLFPEAELWVPRPTLFTLKSGSLPLTGTLGDAPNSAWAADLDQLAFKGSPLVEEVIFLHRESRTLILDDLIQSHPSARPHSGAQSHPSATGRFTMSHFVRNLLFAALGVAAPGGVARDIRLSFTNRALARQSLERLLSWDFDKLIIAHGACLERDAKPFVERAFAWLETKR